LTGQQRLSEEKREWRHTCEDVQKQRIYRSSGQLLGVQSSTDREEGNPSNLGKLPVVAATQTHVQMP
jgi:hypothetical protein